MNEQGNVHQRQLTSDELRDQIAATRSRLAQDLEAARAKFSREGLRHEVASAIRGVRREGSGAVSDLGDSAGRGASQLGTTVIDFLRRYPVATTIIGLGFAWLAMRGNRSRGSGPREIDRDELPTTWRTLEAEPHGRQ